MATKIGGDEDVATMTNEDPPSQQTGELVVDNGNPSAQTILYTHALFRWVFNMT
jgi:hypothetical protein